MISCKQCHTPNSLDSKYCKRCGAEIPAEELAEAQAKLDHLIEEGNALFNQARVDEALAIAEAAVAANPSSVKALSLKALCHERRGEIAEALDAADRIVDLNPDSEFDRIRRSTLRQKLQTEYHLYESPDRRIALLGAVGAIVLVLCAGVLFARMSNPPVARATEPTTVAMNPAGDPSPRGVDASSVRTNSEATRSTTSPSTADPAPRESSPRSTGEETAGRDPDRVAPLRESPTPEVSRAAPVGGLPTAGGPQINVTPVTPPETPPVSPPDPNDRNVETPSKPPAKQPVTEEPENVGEISIQTHPGNDPRPTNRVPTGSQSISGTGLQALLRVGSQQFELGNFDAAAKSYEQALQNGGDQIILNRRLGQAYQRLGRNSDAAEAYRRCMAAAESALAAGRGNRDALNQTRDLCRQELKVLGG